jgi:general stress protein YciG
VAGNKEGGRAAAETNKRKYGHGFYAEIGKLGGAKGRTGGFASDKIGADGLTGRERAAHVGRVGGAISRRGAKKAKIYGE